jgi:predicted phage tail protein
MSGKPIRVRLYGRLAKEFGDEFEFYVDTPAAAIRMLEANFQGRFYKHLKRGYYHLVKGPEFDTGVGLTEDHIGLQGFAGETVHLMPVMQGAGSNKGLFAVIIGVVLIGAAIILSGGTLAAPLAGLITASGGLTLYGTAAVIGVSLALGGISALLAPTPDTKSFADREEDKAKPGRLFNGPVNTVQPGNCVPLVYGRCRVGSAVVSAGITVKDKST